MERRLPHLGRRHQVSLRRLEKHLEKLGVRPGIYLYGSRIFGTEAPDSDLDVFVSTKTPLSEDQKYELRAEYSREGLGVVIYGEENFYQDRVDLFFDSPAFESIARTAVGWNTSKALRWKLSDEQFLRQSWIWAFVMLRSIPELKPPYSLKELHRSILVGWALEQKISPDVLHAHGIFVLAMLSGEIRPDTDPLWDPIKETGLCWSWLPGHPTELYPPRNDLIHWVDLARVRLKKFAHILGELQMEPISTEGLEKVQRNPLYSGVKWEARSHKGWVARDNGAEIVIAIKRIGWAKAP